MVLLNMIQPSLSWISTWLSDQPCGVLAMDGEMLPSGLSDRQIPSSAEEPTDEASCRGPHDSQDSHADSLHVICEPNSHGSLEEAKPSLNSEEEEQQEKDVKEAGMGTSTAKASHVFFFIATFPLETSALVPGTGWM